MSLTFPTTLIVTTVTTRKLDIQLTAQEIFNLGQGYQLENATSLIELYMLKNEEDVDQNVVQTNHNIHFTDC